MSASLKQTCSAGRRQGAGQQAAGALAGRAEVGFKQDLIYTGEKIIIYKASDKVRSACSSMDGGTQGGGGGGVMDGGWKDGWRMNG